VMLDSAVDDHAMMTALHGVLEAAFLKAVG
jgi:hypothetical protein